MDFSTIFQLKTKKYWWMDVIFYFVISLLLATVFCWLIFLVKDSMQRKDIEKEDLALQTVGTDQQKDHEKEVITYQGKIADFTGLLKNHQFASNVFAFMQEETMPNIWFKQFSLSEKDGGAQLSGESDKMDAFSRQVAVFEDNKYVKSVGNLSSAAGGVSKNEFNMNLVLDQSIFNYLASIQPASAPATPTGQFSSQQATAPPKGAPSSEKLITSFHLLLNPEVIGTVNETNYTVTLNVPYGADVKNLTPSIVTSPGATVLPASNVPQDFDSPVVYRVTAEDKSVQNYIVTVVVATQPVSQNSSGQSGSVVIIFIAALAAVIVIAAAVFLFIRRKKSPKVI